MIGRDGELAPIEQFVCHLYDTPEQQTVDNARLQLFGKGKLGLEMLPPTREAETPWNFTPHAPTIKQRSGCRQTRSI